MGELRYCRWQLKYFSWTANDASFFAQARNGRLSKVVDLGTNQKYSIPYADSY